MSQQENTPDGPKDTLPTEEYYAIESAVLETARGRWFLEEYARRNRVADTKMLLGAISRLENTMGQEPEQRLLDTAPITNASLSAQDIGDNETVEELHLEVAELSAAIQLTRQEIKELGSQQAQDGGFEPVTNELDDIFEHTEQAVSSILRAAEAMQASAWAAREEGTDTDICDRLDKCVIEIYTACTFQELTGQRISKLISLLNFTESRVLKMLQRWNSDEATDGLEAKAVPESIPEPAIDPVQEAGPADVFETDTFNDSGETEAGNAAFQLAPKDSNSDEDAPTGNDPFEGQDTFVSTLDTLKSVGRS